MCRIPNLGHFVAHDIFEDTIKLCDHKQPFRYRADELRLVRGGQEVRDVPEPSNILKNGFSPTKRGSVTQILRSLADTKVRVIGKVLPGNQLLRRISCFLRRSCVKAAMGY